MNIADDNESALTPENDASGDLRSPEYRVTFWKPEDDEDDEDIYRFSTRNYRCSHAGSVTEVISWAEKNARPNEDLAVLFVQVETDERGRKWESMYLIHGRYPEGLETSPGPDFSWTMRKIN